MSGDCNPSCVLVSPRDSRISCVFQTADEKDDVPAVGEESVLEMLSCSKFSDLETWLCMPSSMLLPRLLDSTRTSSSSSSSSSSNCRQSTCSDADAPDRSPEREAAFLTPALGKETPFLATPLLPILSSTPAAVALMSPGDSASRGGVSIRKRRRLAASPGGLHWKSAVSVQTDVWSADPSVGVEERGAGEPAKGRLLARGGGASQAWVGHRAAVRKTVSVDDQLLQPAGREQRHLKLLSRLERGRKKLRNVHSLGAPSRYDSRKKTDGKISRLAQRWNRRAAGDALIQELQPWFYTGLPGSSVSLDRHLPAVMTQQMQNLQLSQAKKCPGGPASPNAAKRLYRNLSEKLRGSTSSFEDTYFFGKTDRLRKASTMQGSDCLFEAVEQQDLDTVQILLTQFSAEELDLNTPNSQGLTPLDIAVMTDNTPIAKMLQKAGGKEGPHVASSESREAHLSALVAEAEQRASDLAARAQRDGLSLEACHKDKQLRAWEWRCKLYKRMMTGLRNARAPEAPTMVRLSAGSSSSLTVTFQEPQGLTSSVVTKYRVEWSCLKDFSLLAGEMLLDNLPTLRCNIGGLTTGRVYFVRVCACNMKGWGPPASSSPPSAAPSNWRESEGRESRRRSHIEAMERLLQQVRATHSHYCCGDASKLQNPSRKQSVSRSLKHLFYSSNKFVKTLKRGIYLAAVFYHKDSLLVTAEDQIPIVEVDDSYSSSLMQDFLWFTKLSCMWEDVRWLRQSTSVSMSSSSTLQARHKMLSAAGQLQNLLGTHNLGRVHYEPIKDRHGNVLLVTIRDTESQHSLFSGKWMQVTKLQSQRKSLSTPEEPYALDILIITLQDILAYQRRSTHRLAPGLYLGYLKLSSSVDQIRVLVSQRTPNMLCHVRVRENSNVSREEWDWIRKLSAAGEKDPNGEESEETRPRPESHAPLLFYELQTAIKSLLKHVNLHLHQARHFRLYSQEVVELGHGVSFLLLLPAADDVCSAPGQSNPYTPLAGFLHLPLQMFELVHFCSYKEKFISLYCRLSSVLDLDALITQQAVREAITDGEVSTARQRHQLILDFIHQLDETRRDLRWLTDALQYARYKHPRGGVPVTCLVDASEAGSDSGQQKNDSASSNMDSPPTPSPSPQLSHRKAISDSLLCSDEDGFSEVFLPTDSDYDSSDALSPRELDLLYSPPQDLSQQALHSLGGSAPDVLQIHELRYTTPPPKDLPLTPAMKEAPLLARSPSQTKDSPFASGLPRSPSLPRALPTSPCTPLSPRFPGDLPLSPTLCDTARNLQGLSLSKDPHESAPPPRALSNPPSKRKLLSRSHRGQYFSGPQRWLRGHSGECHTGSLSEGVYTKQRDPDPPLPEDPPPTQGLNYVSRTTCVLESRKARLRDQRPHVRRIFVEDAQVVGEEPVGAASQDVDSDDQTNAQVSEILSSTL
ncbi:ankyrin repeat and fibronectin type-III domain-containing protein 1 isoform X1 [Nerophis ophidion]|uniref:ankyrin repeat and fibronectin type-III domain-containing protein 1 isoform X1 n=1 Tax=Nerophis ophidion TaxID=159077 RepID=UPI002AE09B13|nr:ankyrin repeat and fibronectin type-III domain-containing protein 1 isoform X1 [Nerophis ophidion]XP_061732007.1 ankyrin repeat and fibronectin type-III domain-containing protein 1 isoform X1 [Nerophis ophidion]XP_061732008.1 ankyrin repeat and fibronectin type-III domain-containing protein 1 isoform X1 [Nerophis ophidion]XP_061732009.1 ankyrin repeat and fibronectin type-III domain-containing protein 1 isoform X1 [Nerophis ophidion]